jgi:hypothetical protein
LTTISYTVVTIRDGVVVSTRADKPTLLRARDKPEMSISSAQMLFGGTHAKNGSVYTDTTACQPIAISPNGVNAACLRIDGKGTLTLYSLSDPVHTQFNVRATVGEFSARMMGFTSDRELAVVADDDSCPFYRRSDGKYADEPQARVKVIDMHGMVLKSGPCVHGIIVGDDRIAYLTHDPSGNALYSVDGDHWLSGQPMTFDGSGELLFIDGDSNLLDRKGRLIAPNVVGGYWTK